ncbi:MAG TPA: BLUF domain-containing protein [Gemmatimonadaceae bacterium]
MLRRLAWFSRASVSFSTARLRESAALWRFNNERNHLSGMLLFSGVHFLAVLEGQECDLDRLWRRLQQDKRHRDVIRIGEIACGRRWFPHWILSCTTDPMAAAEIERLRSSQEPIASKWTQLVPPIMVKAMADAGSYRDGAAI